MGTSAHTCQSLVCRISASLSPNQCGSSWQLLIQRTRYIRLLPRYPQATGRDGLQGFADMKKKLHDVAVSHDGQLVFSWIDSTRWNHWLQKQFNIDGKVVAHRLIVLSCTLLTRRSQKPAMVVYDYNSERHWPAKDGTLATAESITKFLKDVADNKIEVWQRGHIGVCTRLTSASKVRRSKRLQSRIRSSGTLRAS